MPPLYHEPKVTFGGGEFSPEMYSRIDLAKYTTGLKTARNVFIHPQGGVSNRPGFRYVAAAISNTTKSRLIPFEFSDTQSYMLEFGYQKIRFFINGGQVISGSVIQQWSYTPTIYQPGDQFQYLGIIYQLTGPFPGNANLTLSVVQQNPTAYGLTVIGPVSGNPYEVVTPYLDTDLPLLKYTQSADTIFLAHPNHAPMTLERVADNNWVLMSFAFLNGPYMPANANTSLTLRTDLFAGTGELFASAALFEPGHVGTFFRVNAIVSNQTTTSTLALLGATTAAISGYKTWKIVTTGTWAGDVQIQVAFTTTGPVWTKIQDLTSNNDANYNTSGAIPYDFPVFIRAQAELTSGSVTVVISCDDFNYDYNLKVTAYTSSTDVTVSQVAQFGGWPNATIASTDDWSEGSWSAVRGWPSAVTFFQDRLGWASTPAEPQGSWWSETGNYPNYGVSDPLVDSDAIAVAMPTRKLNQVKHLLPMTINLALTSSGAISIGPGGSGDFTPTSVDVRPQPFHGAADASPVIVGLEAIFVQARSALIRNMVYQYFTNIFTSTILNLMSMHLFTNYTILDMTYAESPDSQIYAVRSDGQLLCFTYLPEQQVMAWTHWDTNGSFESCCVIPSSTYDELWVVVNRPNGRFIERLAQRLPTTDTKDQFHVDCGIDYNGAAASTISGLSYLNGQQVRCLADGNVQGPFTVVAGSITLRAPASLVHIGLAYTCDVETLNVEVPGQDGTTQGKRGRVTYVTMRVTDSLGGFIGPSSAKLHAIIMSQAPSLDSYAPLFSGDLEKISITPDWKSNGRMFYRQTDPLPFTITGLFPVVETGNL